MFYKNIVWVYDLFYRQSYGIFLAFSFIYRSRVFILCAMKYVPYKLLK